MTAIFGGTALYGMLRLESIGDVTGGRYIVAAFLAAGVALITVGGKAVRENRGYRSQRG